MTLTMKDVLNINAKDFPLADPKHWREFGTTEFVRKAGDRIKAIESANKSAAKSTLRFKVKQACRECNERETV